MRYSSNILENYFKSYTSCILISYGYASSGISYHIGALGLELVLKIVAIFFFIFFVKGAFSVQEVVGSKVKKT